MDARRIPEAPDHQHQSSLLRIPVIAAEKLCIGSRERLFVSSNLDK
jgi:hypothetical protein